MSDSDQFATQQFHGDSDLPGDVEPGDLGSGNSTSGESTSDEAESPKQVGRYLIEAELGKGGFGTVFLAFDQQLNRQVTVKVPHQKFTRRPEVLSSYIEEAQTVANLDHPHIVPVFDVGNSSTHPFFVVSKYIEGKSLSKRLKQTRFGFNESVLIVADVADALHYAHLNRLVHRDIKPGNILIDENGKAYVLDFGLALREENIGQGPKFAGTPQYMSPEQARGEGHRVDGRSDIFSLGVVFYEMLVGNRPFLGKSSTELFDQVTRLEPRPPRQSNDQIPRELERICLKAMAKRASERYSTATDLASDLYDFLSDPPSSRLTTTVKLDSQTRVEEANRSSSVSEKGELTGSQIKVIPKGLRAFDSHDADFFLGLLPGPRDRTGLPDIVRFWKTRIEEPDEEECIPIGIIYGPSGCGKSSLIKAGIIPRLSDSVVPVYVECTPDGTEANIQRRLGRSLSELDESLGLAENLASLRRGEGLPKDQKLLLVLDQFEQWLHSTTVDRDQLVAALRQCDGVRVQCLLLVRDEFWLAISRFMHDLEIRIRDGENSRLVDVFDEDHARKVLAAFGQAYGKVAPIASDITEDQQTFINQAIRSLAVDNGLISVRIALFADMMKGKAWNPGSLKAVGGAAGVGVTFLEETFSASTAPPEHQRLQKAARNVLSALLPESGADIKGSMKSQERLLAASGYANNRKDFDELIYILDTELRLITPIDSELSLSDTSDAPAEGLAGDEGLDSGEVLDVGDELETAGPSERTVGQKDSASSKVSRSDQGCPACYQLTHDYLVHSLRDWLTRKQKETRRGRAELQLAEYAALWNIRRDRRYLPNWWEHVNIRILTEPRSWSRPQAAMMASAGRRHGLLTLLVVLIAVTCLASGMIWNNAANHRKNEAEAERLVDILTNAETSRIDSILEDLEPYRPYAEDDLKQTFQQSSPESNAKLHAAIALLRRDRETLAFVSDRLLSVSPAQFTYVRNEILPYNRDVAPRYWELSNAESESNQRKFMAACALAYFDRDHTRWSDHEFCTFVATELLNLDTASLDEMRVALQPVKEHLIQPLTRFYIDEDESEQARLFATETLAYYLSQDVERLFKLLINGDAHQFGVMQSKLLPYRQEVVALAEAFIAEPATTSASRSDQQLRARQQANAAILLLNLDACNSVWPLFESSSIPLLRGYLINRIAEYDADPKCLLDQLAIETKPSRIFGLILALGQYKRQELPEAQGTTLIAKLKSDYSQGLEPGIRSATEWLLRTWGQGSAIREIDLQLVEQAFAEDENGVRRGVDTASGLFKSIDDSQRRWFVHPRGLTFAVFDAHDSEMGSPPDEDRRAGGENQHTLRINRRLAFATKEVTRQQWQAFADDQDEVRGPGNSSARRFANGTRSPITSITWYEAARYCNWLSEQAGIPEEQWCYEPNRIGRYGPGMRAKDHFWELTGYRIPTEAEWEFACRSGTDSSRYYGNSESLLHFYAWFQFNSNSLMSPVGRLKPNEFGLFDMQGNAIEWCFDRFEMYPRNEENVIDDFPQTGLIDADGARSLRGGSIYYQPPGVRSANRDSYPAKTRSPYIGFRPCRTLALLDTSGKWPH